MKRVLVTVFLTAAALAAAPGPPRGAAEAASPPISARAAFVMEAATGRILFSKNPDTKVQPASTVKLLTAMVALDRMALDDVVTVSKRAVEVSPVKADLKAGEKWTVRALLYAALVKSANDAAYALAEAAAGTEVRFADLMNKKAGSLGARASRFKNSTGLPEKGQFSTARDMAAVMKAALQYENIREALETREVTLTAGDGRELCLENSNKLLWIDDRVMGGKTGYTRAARHCLVFAAGDNGHRFIGAVMGSKSRKDLWRESADVLESAAAKVDEKAADCLVERQSKLKGKGAK